jgi:hypothetical protein
MRVYYERYSAHFEAKFVKIKILFVIIHTTECSRKSSQATVPLMLLPSHHSFVGLFSFLISLLSSCLAGHPDWLVRALLSTWFPDGRTILIAKPQAKKAWKEAAKMSEIYLNYLLPPM